MEEIKEIILSHCQGIAYPEFELEDLNVMVKEINDHYTKVQSQELTKAKEEVESLKKLLSENITDANDQRHNFVMSEIKVKSQAKELEGLRELIENIKVIQTHQLEDFPSSYECLKTMCKSDELLMDEYSDGYVEVEELRELLKDTTQPDKGGE